MGGISLALYFAFLFAFLYGVYSLIEWCIERMEDKLIADLWYFRLSLRHSYAYIGIVATFGLLKGALITADILPSYIPLMERVSPQESAKIPQDLLPVMPPSCGGLIRAQSSASLPGWPKDW
jgi:hypothetical protein